MVDSTIVNIIRRYLAALPAVGIHSAQAVLFGSLVRGENNENSDIDLIVIAPEFDGPRELELIENLWLATASSDNRIEPIPCGEHEWETEGGRPILDIARSQGVIIAA